MSETDEDLASQKLRAEIDKLRVDRDFAAYQTSRTYRILECLKERPAWAQSLRRSPDS